MKLSIKLNNLAFYIYLITFCWGQELSFKDMTEQGALDFIHDHGGSGEYYYVESMGSGICIFDYDNDGDLDAYFPQSSPLPGWKKDVVLENKLFRNDNLHNRNH